MKKTIFILTTVAAAATAAEASTVLISFGINSGRELPLWKEPILENPGRK